MSMFIKTGKPSETREPEPVSETKVMESKGGQQQGAAGPGSQKGAPSIIGPRLTITGNLESDGEIQIDGTVKGDIRGKSVTVGESATVDGSVDADSVRVSGAIEGKIEAKSVAIMRTGRVIGDVIHESLEVEAGAYLDGHCRRTDARGESKTTALTSLAGGSQKHGPSTDAPKIGSAQAKPASE